MAHPNTSPANSKTMIVSMVRIFSATNFSNHTHTHLDYRHLVILSGSPVDTEDVLARLRKDFGQTVRMKPIDSTNHVITLANMLDGKLHNTRSNGDRRIYFRK